MTASRMDREIYLALETLIEDCEGAFDPERLCCPYLGVKTASAAFTARIERVYNNFYGVTEEINRNMVRRVKRHRVLARKRSEYNQTLRKKFTLCENLLRSEEKTIKDGMRSTSLSYAQVMHLKRFGFSDEFNVEDVEFQDKIVAGFIETSNYVKLSKELEVNLKVLHDVILGYRYNEVFEKFRLLDG